LISGHALILLKSIDEIKKGLGGEIVALDGLRQGHEDGRLGSAGETIEGLGAEIGKEAEGFVAVAGFVAEIIRDAAKCVYVAEILAEAAGQQERDDREIFVMGLGELSGLNLRAGQVVNSGPGHVDG